MIQKFTEWRMELHDHTWYWTFICIVGCTFVVGGVVGLILTACLTAGRDKDDNDDI